MIIQAKRYVRIVGINVVLEVTETEDYYKANDTWIVSSHDLT